MTQKSRPDADLYTGSWSPTPVYPYLKGAGGYATSGSGVAGDTFAVKLSSLALPQVSCGDLVLTTNLDKTEVGSLPTTISLDQGDQVITHATVEPSGSVQLTLTPAEAERITDYSALGVTITAGVPEPPCCAVPVAAVLGATFHDMTCPALDGVEVTLRYRGAGVLGVIWSGENPDVCGLRLKVELTCSGSGIGGFFFVARWFNDVNCTVPFTGGALVDSTCDPFRLHFTFSGIPVGVNCPCCTNTFMSGELDITPAA